MPFPVGCWCPSSLVLDHLKVRGTFSTECSHDTDTETGSYMCSEGFGNEVGSLSSCVAEREFSKEMFKDF